MATKKNLPEGEIVTARRGRDGEWTGHPDAIREATEAIAAAKERDARWPQTPEGYVDTRAAMTVLARLFPTLRTADSIDPWNADRFLAWMCGPISSGPVHAGRFLLSVWNPSTDWREVAREKGIDFSEGRLDRFDLHDAVAVWDPAHRLACMTWIDAPFWP
jgi:hypothetical protein